MKIISFINMKGGVGKTTLATNVAYSLSKQFDKKVLMLDLDPQFNATQCFWTSEVYMDYCDKEGVTVCGIFEDNVVRAISTVEGEKKRLPKTFNELKPQKINENLYLLPGNLNLFRTPITADSGKHGRVKQYIEEIQKEYNFDYVIIDTPPTPSIWMTSALLASDYFMVPVKADPLSMTGIDLLQNIVEQTNNNFDHKVKCLGLVLTMVEEQTKVYQAAMKYLETNKRWSKLLFSNKIPKRTAIARDQLNQRFIYDIGDAESKLALTNIIDEMINRIGE